MEPEMLVNELEHELKEVVTCCPKKPTKRSKQRVGGGIFSGESRLVKMGLDGFGLDECGES